MDSRLRPNFDKERYSLETPANWVNPKNLLVHHYIEVTSTETGCIFTYMLGSVAADSKDTTFLSPDIVTSGCRKRAEECLEKQSKKENYTYTNREGRILTVLHDDLYGCNQVCIGIHTIIDKDDRYGNNNLPRGFIVPGTEGHLTKVQVEILDYIHKNATDNGKPNEFHGIYLTAPFDYGLTCSVPGVRTAQKVAAAAGKVAGKLGDYLGWQTKKEESFKEFANCQTFARDFALTPVYLHNKLYPGNPDRK